MPAYHMNKMHWITVLLDGTVPEKRVLELIDITDYANLITKALPKSILLNTNGDKFNSMVIGWGHSGTLWGRPTFHVYVRQGRYTKGQLGKTGEFTVSVPLDKPDAAINRICGWQSGNNIDIVREAGCGNVRSAAVLSKMRTRAITVEKRLKRLTNIFSHRMRDGKNILVHADLVERSQHHPFCGAEKAHRSLSGA